MDTATTVVEPSLVKEIGKTFALSTATTAGVWGGIVLIGLTLTAAQKRKERKAQKNATNETD